MEGKVDNLLIGIVKLLLIRKSKVYLYLVPYTIINSIYIKHLNVKYKKYSK